MIPIPFSIPFLCATNWPTGDRRIFRTIELAAVPMPFRVQFADDEHHIGAVPVGRLEDVVANLDGTFSAVGHYDPTPDGIRAARLAASQSMMSCSVETDEFEGFITEDDGIDIAHARVRGATQLAIGAWAECQVIVDPAAVDAAEAALATDPPTAADAPVVVNITAAGDSWAPPREWFNDPTFGATDEDDPRLAPYYARDGRILGYKSPLYVDDDGRVFGHLAGWRECHTGQRDVCVNPPASNTGYAYFHTGEMVCSGGARIACGVLTFDTSHASTSVGKRAALEHYDNTGTIGAFIRVGEDAHGIWFAGAARPDLTGGQLATLRATGPSGDWRREGGNLELAAALSVNWQGFPGLRPRIMVAAGLCQALVAAGATPVRRGPSADARLAAMERIIAPLLPSAADRTFLPFSADEALAELAD